VIATVILVAVTIVVAVAVSYWMGAIAGLYTRFEKIEITSCYVVKEGGYYNITIQLKNSGSQDATITYILLNGKPTDQYTESKDGFNVTVRWEINGQTGNLHEKGLTIPLGSSGTIYIWFKDSAYESGTTVNLQIHSAAGKDYPQMLSLP